MLRRDLSLRTRILLAIVGAVVATDLLATLAIQVRFVDGARREAHNQAASRVAMARALYAERAATLAADAERIALYPAVIAAVEGRNAQPLLRWGTDVAARQGIHVRVVDATGATIAHGHTHERLGPRWDGLVTAAPLEGMQLALAGRTASGVEASNEVGLAVRGYAPVRREGLEGPASGPVVGAVMLADPLDEPLLAGVAGGREIPGALRVEPLDSPVPTPSVVARSTPAGAPGSHATGHLDPGGGSGGGPAMGGQTEDGPAAAPRCDPPAGVASATCRAVLFSPTGRPVATLVRTVPLTEVERAHLDAQRAVWLMGGLLVVPGAVGAWLLAGSLAAPLARLTAAAGRVAGGDYDRPTGVPPGDDEIGGLARAFEVMRQRVAESTGTLRHERDLREAVLDSTGDGILMVTRAGETAVANARWSEFVGGEGLTAAAALVRTDGDGTLGETAAAWLADPERVASADFERPAPPYRHFRCYSAPVPAVSECGRAPCGRIFVLRDMTRESEAERLRSAFVATVSHDLRSPLAAIAGYADTLLRDDAWDRETRREFLEVIAASADTLTRLVDNLLDAATLEAGVLRLEPEPVRVERIAERVVAHRRPLTPTHDLRLDVAPGVPLASADPLRVEQVLTNLVDNAIKYSPEGGPVTVRVAPGPGGAAPDSPRPNAPRDASVVVAVSDRGVGLTAEQAGRVFDRFYRATDALGGAPRGIGLGLFLCKRLVEAQGGRIWAESTPGRGTTFTFTLPALVMAEDGGRDRRLPVGLVPAPEAEAAAPAEPAVPAPPLGALR
jgi:signal transduction histidine kinase